MLNPRYLNLNELIQYTLDNPEIAGPWACALAHAVESKLTALQKRLDDCLGGFDDDHK